MATRSATGAIDGASTCSECRSSRGRERSDRVLVHHPQRGRPREGDVPGSVGDGGLATEVKDSVSVVGEKRERKDLKM